MKFLSLSKFYLAFTSIKLRFSQRDPENLDKLIVEPFLMLYLQRNFNWMLRFFPQKKSLIWVWNSLLVWRPHIPLYLWNFWIGFERFRRFGDVGLSRLSMAIENLIWKCSPEKKIWVFICFCNKVDWCTKRFVEITLVYVLLKICLKNIYFLFSVAFIVFNVTDISSKIN